MMKPESIKRMESGLLLFIISQPIFLLTLKEWGNAILILASIFSTSILLVSNNLHNKEQNSTKNFWSDKKIVICCFSGFFLATLTSAVFRTHFDWPLLDSPLRFILAIPVFIFVAKTSGVNSKFFSYASALGLLATLAYQTVTAKEGHWSSDRMSTHFADPLSFGYICLTFTCTVLAQLVFGSIKSKTFQFSMLIVVFIGIYLSLQSGSRTGWLAMPLVLVIFSISLIKNKNTTVVLGLFSAILAILGASFIAPNAIQERFHLAFKEVSDYPLAGIAPDTSIGLRVTFVRLGFDMMKEHPLLGVGDTQKNSAPIPSASLEYASKFAQEFALNSGFHNEIITNGVQSGALAALATLLLFIGPLIIYTHAMNSDSIEAKIAGLIGISFVAIIFVSSLSTEVFGLKFTASYYALTNALLCGICLRDTNNST